jgi:hypothetical protein
VRNSGIGGDDNKRNDSRKSQNPSSAHGNRRKITEGSPDIFKNVANQSLNGIAGVKQGTPVRSNLKKHVPSRPGSAQSKDNKKKDNGIAG